MVVKPRIIGINMIVRNIDVTLCFAFRLPPAPRERAIGDTWLAAGARFFAKAPRPNHHFGQRRRIQNDIADFVAGIATRVPCDLNKTRDHCIFSRAANLIRGQVCKFLAQIYPPMISMKSPAGFVGRRV